MLFGGKLEENHFSTKRGVLQTLVMLFFISINCILNRTEVDDISQNFMGWSVRFLKNENKQDLSENKHFEARKTYLRNLYI